MIHAYKKTYSCQNEWFWIFDRQYQLLSEINRPEGGWSQLYFNIYLNTLKIKNIKNKN